MGNCLGGRIKAELHRVSAASGDPRRKTTSSPRSELVLEVLMGLDRTGMNSRSDGSKDGSGRVSSSSSSVPPTPRSEEEILQSSNLKSFTFGELRTATRSFRPDSVLREGGFGSVFKGWIDENSLAAAKPGTGMVIFIKRLNQEGFQEYREWLAGVNYLGQLYHPNLVKADWILPRG